MITLFIARTGQDHASTFLLVTGLVILSILGLALVDAANPFSIAAMVLLMATDRPMARGWVFIVATLAVNVPFGIVLVEGWTAALPALLPLLRVWLMGVVVLGGGVACIWLAIRLLLRKPGEGPGASLNTSLTLTSTAAFAVASTLSDAPTALPFFAAAALIPDLASGRIGQYLWIVLYCLVYVSPLAVLLGVRATMGAKGTTLLAQLQDGIGWSFRHLFPPLLVLGGAWLCWLGAERLLSLT